jgi:uncharacterized membrane protein YeiB
VTTTAQGPTGVSDRALGPDLARGFMLLFIALANSHYFLRGPSALGGFPTWMLTVVLADRMRRADDRGPFEILLRRFTYRTGVSGRPAVRR